jgi:hypothetical protein
LFRSGGKVGAENLAEQIGQGYNMKALFGGAKAIKVTAR